MNPRLFKTAIPGLYLLLLIAGCQTPSPKTTASPASSAKTETAAYVFGWGELPESIAKPRGGSSRGAPVTLAPGRTLPLQEIAVAPDAFARDRAAILSLAGDYKVSFHFMESVGLVTGYQPTRPYHSWATEQVRVIEDTGRFISIQHTLVMFMKQEDGTVSSPALVKHWRQDWTYEDIDLHTYRGDSTWARHRLTATEAAGTWSQAVFQVDDSPRYEASGRWEHRGNLSAWTGDNEMRPLPRREHTVRQNYTVLEGTHRIVLTPTGWLHEQRNWKRITGETTAAGSPRYLAQEIGLDRYERIAAPSLAAADEYWVKTGAYWTSVRRAWADAYARNDRINLRPECDGMKLFEIHFAYAKKLEDGALYDPADATRHASATIDKFLRKAEHP